MDGGGPDTTAGPLGIAGAGIRATMSSTGTSSQVVHLARQMPSRLGGSGAGQSRSRALGRGVLESRSWDCTQRLSEANFTVANELLRLGRLGEVHTVRAHIAPWDDAYMRHDFLPEEPLPPQEEVDWDLWLGPCPNRPYNHEYVKGAWRGHYDFHTSCIGEWGAHTFAQCQVAIGAGDTSAIAYTYVNNKTGDGMVTKYANGMKMVL